MSALVEKAREMVYEMPQSDLVVLFKHLIAAVEDLEEKVEQLRDMDDFLYEELRYGSRGEG